MNSVPEDDDDDEDDWLTDSLTHVPLSAMVARK